MGGDGNGDDGSDETGGAEGERVGVERQESGSGIRERRIEYCPLPSQRKFHESRARFKGFSGPIGSGKSQALCQEALKLAYQNPGRTGLIAAPTYPMLRDATQAALIELLQSNAIPFEWNRAENFAGAARDEDRRFCFAPWKSSSGCAGAISRGSDWTN